VYSPAIKKDQENAMLTRRHLFTAGAGLALTASGDSLKSFRAAAASIDLPAALPEGARSNAILDALPGKKPLIKLSYRPPNYETPIEYFRTAITPNDLFFVRYPSLQYSRSRCQDLENRRRRRRR
jgi:hypothetical protein